MAQDYYQTLGLSKSATQDEIQKAYRRLARKYHPDLNPDDKAAQQKFKDIQLAYDVLSEPEKRKAYDQFGPDYERVAASPFHTSGGQGGGPAGGFSFEDILGGGKGGGFQFEGDLGDIFRQFGGGGAAGRGGGRARAQTKGRDLSTEHTIGFQTAVLGGEAQLSVSRNGKTESLQIKIPPGVESGRKIRLRGQGEPSPSGGPPGDLLVTLNISPHPYFKRVGRNLELRLPITIGEAVLGKSVDVPTPTGTVTVKIPPGSSSGRRLRVRGQGVRGAAGEDAGDLYVELLIKLPESLPAPEEFDEPTRQALERLETFYSGSEREKIIW